MPPTAEQPKMPVTACLLYDRDLPFYDSLGLQREATPILSRQPEPRARLRSEHETPARAGFRRYRG